LAATSGPSIAIRSPISTCSGCSGGLSMRCTPDRSTYPNLYAHYDRMMARPAVQKTLKAEAAVGYNLPG
jgi:glutathione S-transferase